MKISIARSFVFLSLAVVLVAMIDLVFRLWIMPSSLGALISISGQSSISVLNILLYLMAAALFYGIILKLTANPLPQWVGWVHFAIAVFVVGLQAFKVLRMDFMISDFGSRDQGWVLYQQHVGWLFNSGVLYGLWYGFLIFFVFVIGWQILREDR